VSIQSHDLLGFTTLSLHTKSATATERLTTKFWRCSFMRSI